MRGDAEVSHAASVVGENDQHEQDLKPYRGDAEEVDRDEVRGVIGEERPLGRRRWLESTDPVLLNRRLRDFDAEFAKLTYDAW